MFVTRSASSLSGLFSVLILIGSLPVTSAWAQYRSNIGCSAEKIDALSTASLKKLRCECFGVDCDDAKAPPPPPGSDAKAPAPPPVTTYRYYEGRDIDGADFKTLRDVNFDRCTQACQQDPLCQAFSFDKWNRYCFLKHSFPT